MALSETQIFGFSETVQGTVEKQMAPLAKAGVNGSVVLAGLQSLHSAAVAANEAQEAAKRNARQSTVTFEALKDDLYEMSSGVLDMVIAAVGKNSDAGKNLRRYRSRIHRPPRDGVVLPPEPASPTP